MSKKVAAKKVVAEKNSAPDTGENAVNQKAEPEKSESVEKTDTAPHLTDQKALHPVSHNNKIYAPGDVIPDLTDEQVARLNKPRKNVEAV